MLYSVPLLFWVLLGCFAVYCFFALVSPKSPFTNLQRGAIGIGGFISALLDVIFLLQLQIPPQLLTRLYVVTVIASLCFIAIIHGMRRGTLPVRVVAAWVIAGEAIYPFYLETLLSTTNIMSGLPQ